MSTPIAGTLIRTGVRRAAGGAVVAGPRGAEAAGAVVAGPRGVEAGGAVVAGPRGVEAEIAARGLAVGEFAPVAEGAVVTAEGEQPAMAIMLAAAQATPGVVSRRVAEPTRR